MYAPFLSTSENAILQNPVDNEAKEDCHALCFFYIPLDAMMMMIVIIQIYIYIF